MPAAPPLSTYRLQLHAGFPFSAAAQAVPYLADLGISHVYCSPYLTAAPGSTHGYDIVDSGRVNPELGGAQGLAELAAAAHQRGLGLVLDVVPNHLAVGSELPPHAQNQWWRDVLRHGRESAYAGYFDIDWDAAANPGRVLVPVLGDRLGACLDRGEITVERDGEGRAVAVRYYGHDLPVAPGTELFGGRSPAELLALLDAQHYRLCHWRVAGEELNYRRFFDITTLAGVRVEDPAVFEATHRLVVEQVREGLLTGLRIDHPDGLADPRGYLRRLADATGSAWVVVEKVLEPGEHLPADWDCAGTTGYDTLNRVLGLFVDPAGEQPMTELYAELGNGTASYEQVVRNAKALVVTDVLGSEVNRLHSLLVSVCRAGPDTRDLTPRGLREALVAVLTAFEVYRAYVAPGEPLSEESRAQLAAAVRTARATVPSRAAEIDAVAELALGGRAEPPAAAELAVRFQQTCGPVMAKGVEDTAFYRYHRLTALNEVGGDPSRFGLLAGQFHETAAAAQQACPTGMTALSTHDTKRSEDVRARLALLSEVPAEWGAAVRRWSAAGQPYRTGDLPDRNLEYLLWQTLVGAWPLGADRALAYLEKASREAKEHTSWTERNEAYDKAVEAFVTGVLGDEGLVADVAGFVARLLPAARTTSLAQKLIQLTMPGVPDVYQGTELEDLSLVDPDNRRPVDYPLRHRLLAELDGGLSLADVLARADEGLPKLLVVSRALRLRREHPEWFGAAGGYAPLPVTGRRAEHLVGFARGNGAAVTLAPRLVLGLAADWAGTAVTLPAGRWRDVLTGRSVAGGPVEVALVLDAFPVGLLVRS